MNARLPSNMEGPPRFCCASSPDLLVSCDGFFTAACGYTDAFSYIAHNHVFANAQTGKFVFFAVFASAGQWTQA